MNMNLNLIFLAIYVPSLYVLAKVFKISIKQDISDLIREFKFENFKSVTSVNALVIVLCFILVLAFLVLSSTSKILRAVLSDLRLAPEASSTYVASIFSIGILGLVCVHLCRDK